MNEETQPSASIFSRYRSPTFSRNEVQTLINLIERHKYTILNKTTNSAVNQAKELSWEKITKIFNSRGFKHERSTDSLKTKWENLKKDARKLAKNLVDDNNSYSDLTRQIVTMMTEVETNGSTEQNQNMEDNQEFTEPVSNDEKLSQNLKIKSYWESAEDKDSDESNDGNDGEKRMNRSLNFAPQECSLLLECVRKEKKFVFSKEYNAHAIGLKNKAWKRISEAFNSKSPQKRPQKVLRTKFTNMKKVAKGMGIKDAVRNFDMKNTKHEKLINESSKPIKSEPMFEMELELHGPDDDDRHNSDSNHFAPDPLSTVLNSDSGIGSTHSSSWSQDNKEVANLKLKLLNYKMETARLERQRLEEAARLSAATRESDAIAAALRLRAARLDALAAAARLPPAHPALHFTPEELPAERYLRQYENT
ncbi:uncharacterized protein LOC125231865 [Leguminivora glycinivorella]|uniref:uncharacterized protein LOC125231865 n=1 Tax=Leguminivora glycinivorella TaxID=1035111 RepID=UPI0020101B60|nr:uncharacterized protein LOC125231865 [Leguminivora glycinivorella]